MVVTLLLALLRAPFADLGAQPAVLLGIPAVTSHGPNTKLADVDALNTAFGAVAGTLFTRHFGQATFAFNDTLLAGFNAGLESTHDVLPRELVTAQTCPPRCTP